MMPAPFLFFTSVELDSNHKKDVAYDNTLKYLVEQYPEQFTRWLLDREVRDIQILKTELSLEPIRADAAIFVQSDRQILHIEFQTLPVSKPSLPFRMLDYWVRLHRQYECDIEQVLIFLTPTNSSEVFQYGSVNRNRHPQGCGYTNKA